MLADRPSLKRLEQIMHPLVRQEEKNFLASAVRRQVRAVLLDIPLLFESGGEKRVDKTITVSAPRATQIRRVKNRRFMSTEQITAIIAKQMPDAEKRTRADYVIHTGLSRFHTMQAVRRLIKVLLP